MQVLIDGTCPYCRALGRALKALDLGDTLEVRPLQEMEGVLDLDPKALREELHLLKGPRVYRGYGALLALARHLPLLWPLYPFLWVGSILGLGPRVYQWVARGRPHA